MKPQIIDYLLHPTTMVDLAALNALDDEHQTPVRRDSFLYYVWHGLVFV
jgi:hypothetical protein